MPSRSDSLDGNVTKRLKETPRSLAFDTLTEQDPKPTTEDDQVIEALDDMDITEQLDGGLMDCEMQNDDLMGLELAEMEDKTGHERTDQEVMGGQDEESSRGEGDEEINKGQSREADASQANPPDDPLGVHETTPLVEDDGADHSTNVDPLGRSLAMTAPRKSSPKMLRSDVFVLLKLQTLSSILYFDLAQSGILFA
ncbi:hypothetical protein Bca52824_047900 [Brassica carinata]|uniref:Uncharacterized protein n=1 Tax=Brassica carinata TaxID=52824 RepID=A0A8X7RHB2_BRACI|nr:hypothetical protein Bca52824_047900 [Brassica carinata]